MTTTTAPTTAAQRGAATNLIQITGIGTFFLCDACVAAFGLDRDYGIIVSARKVNGSGRGILDGYTCEGHAPFSYGYNLFRVARTLHTSIAQGDTYDDKALYGRLRDTFRATLSWYEAATERLLEDAEDLIFGTAPMCGAAFEERLDELVANATDRRRIYPRRARQYILACPACNGTGNMNGRWLDGQCSVCKGRGV